MKTCMQLVRFILAAELVVIAGLNAAADDIQIVANLSLKGDSISREELRSVFLLRTRKLKDGSFVEPVLRKSGPAHDAFLKQYLERDSEEIRTYYQGLVFTGKAGMPREVNSDAEVIAYVAHTRGAIGYVSSETNTVGVKVLAVVSSNAKAQRSLLIRVEPEYPEALRQRQIGGSVRLKLTISPKGEVEEALVLGGNPILAEEAVKAAQRWVYSPWSSRTTTEVSISFDNSR
jgi:TonB family protein